MKNYLKKSDRVFSTGVFLILDENGRFQVDGFEDDTYYNGQLVNTDEKGYYTESKEENEVEYNVQWNIDIYATSPREAAENAKKIHLDKDSTANLFQVKRFDEEHFENIDLDKEA
jgi:hypothetical protein